ncbi:Coenzyme F420 hydrogenase/dehydrogenase, beta subunit C-terminal domain [Lysobacter auxotrophicus]|uniref:Coenzyme F420 hydrogenase/dehydrogenase, beta subunit C-terminal domain n=1 Tax=Lysobacter auxotrophicus TaxID=2992573 RepID=A0ABN6UIQ6_9GAMM|nr:Coenzyme F420 hydrogenase/dehydrogenase, beta subunit C-terminal domain [Lysobacter auxotrophicus]BDU15987.1 coenzyme F420 hydrogenase/dehydrogenase, beta subunit C-terminal domain [Lysobacter auxotrophicus]
MSAPGPRRMVRSGRCIGCGGCVAQSHGAGMQFDRYGQIRPVGSRRWDRDAAAIVAQTCPFASCVPDEDRLAASLFADAPAHDAATGRYVAAYVGHAIEGGYRDRGSSGGLVSWVACELLRSGRVDAVAHVHACEDPEASGRLFDYRLSRSETDVRRGAGSRYYPVEMSAALRTMLDEPGRYAVVGIPCFVKAVQLMRRRHPQLRERIVHTMGLFCGHMKSARFAESLAWQMGANGDDIRHVDFRRKHPDRAANQYHARIQLRDGRTLGRDWWPLVDGDWGAGFFMDAACNLCDDVMAETADISFGDAWVEPYSSDWRGHNVVVVRTRELDGMLRYARDAGRIALDEVDAAFVAATQAAGLRQRREGLSYRLSKRSDAPPKRVPPDANAATPERRRIYALRAGTSRWSHRMFGIARATRIRAIYLVWARVALTVYHAFAYRRGRLGALVNRLGPG